ncbi:MAG TPA: hypothetical protein PLD99_00915 [Parcubacteria group bacterium]|nr:hypothetical protein [Parcubacteria group bacterium]
MSNKKVRYPVPLSEIVLTPEEQKFLTPEFVEETTRGAIRYVEERRSVTESPEFSVPRTKPAK